MNTFADSAATALHLDRFGADPVLLRHRRPVAGRQRHACLLACGFGLLLGAWLAVARFPGRGAAAALLNTLLALPSVVVGLVVYLLLSRSGPLGSWACCSRFKAMVIAQTILVLPVVTALTRQAVADAAARTASSCARWAPGRCCAALLLVLDERYALLTVLITAFGRAVSEVGAVMIVGGNIDGFTRVMTTAIALETSKGDLPLALALGLVLLAVVLVLNLR